MLPWLIGAGFAVTAYFKGVGDSLKDIAMRPQPANDMRLSITQVGLLGFYAFGLFWALKQGARLVKKLK